MVGHGEEDFEAISQKVLTGNLTNSITWAQLAFQPAMGSKLSPGTTVATITRFYRTPVWSFNPCRVTHCDYNLPNTPGTLRNELMSPNIDASVKRFSRLIYHTLEGHLLSGEERLYVCHHANDQVSFLMQSFAGPGKLAMKPLMWMIRPLQKKFLEDHVNALLQCHNR